MRRSLESALRFDISAGKRMLRFDISAGKRMTHLKQWVSQPLLTGPQASFGEPQNESIRRSAAELIRRGNRPGMDGRSGARSLRSVAWRVVAFEGELMGKRGDAWHAE